MSRPVDRASRWVYSGIWSVLVRWFRVPERPPELPGKGGEPESFHPAEGFLRYLKFWFWLALVPIDVVITVLWIALVIVVPWVGWPLLPVFLAVAIVPDVLAYVAIHLRYDTTWYVMNDRSIRIRRGIWIIQETTITFENVQNVSVRQGPVQRHFGIADVVIQTAGGGGGAQQHAGGGVHEGRIEGVANAPEIRDKVMARVRRSTAAGLGDEAEGPGLSRASLDMLRQVREAARALAGGTP